MFMDNYSSLFPRQMEVIVYVHHDRVLQNYVTPCHRKYNSQHNQSGIRAKLHGKGGCYTVDYYKALSHKDWKLRTSRI